MTGRKHGSAHEADKMARQWPNQDHKRLFCWQMCAWCPASFIGSRACRGSAAICVVTGATDQYHQSSAL